MSLLEVALDLHAQGFRPIPLGGYQEQPPAYFIKRFDNDVAVATDKWPKAARIKWADFQEREPTEEEVTQWWTKWPNANIGLLTGFEFYAVDADSEEAVEWVENNLTPTPWRVKTKQGLHYYYSVSSEDLGIRNSVGENAKVDVRGVGGYVVAAGSRHPSGTYYSNDRLAGIKADFYNDLPELTAIDVEKIKSHNEDMRLAEPRQLPEGTFMDLRLYGAQVIGESKNEGSRNNECTRLAGLYIRQGYAVVEVLEKCQAWNETNNPPLPHGEVFKCVDSVVKTHERKTASSVPVEPAAEKKVEELMFPLGELVNNPPAEPEPFWGNRLLFRGARFMIAGAPKIGKSRFTLAMAVQASCGGKFLNDYFQRPLRTMWMQAEIHKSWLLDRVSQVTPSLSSDEMALVNQNLILSGRLDLDLKASERDFEAATRALDQYRPDIWCVDPIINFSSAEENSNVEVHALLRRINHLASEFDCAVVLVHHTKKPSQIKHTDFDQIRGASAFRGWFDTGVMLTGEPTDPTVSWEARNAESPGAHMAFFDTRLGQYTAHIIEDKEQAEETRQGGQLFYGSAFELLESMGGEASAKQLIDAIQDYLRVDVNTAREAIGAMLENTGAEYIRDGERGPLYRSTPTRSAKSADHSAGETTT